MLIALKISIMVDQEVQNNVMQAHPIWSHGLATVADHYPTISNGFLFYQLVNRLNTTTYYSTVTHIPLKIDKISRDRKKILVTSYLMKVAT